MMTSVLFTNQPTPQQVFCNPLQDRSRSDLSFEIRTLQSMQFNNPKTKSLTQDYYEIVWIKKGAAKFGIDTKRQVIQENHIVLLSPGQRCMFEPLDTIEGYCIYFSQEFLFLSGRLVFDLFHSAKQMKEPIFPSVLLDTSLLQEVEFIIFNMIKEFSNSFKSRSEALQGLLKMLIIHISRKIDYATNQPVTGADRELVEKFILMIDKYFIQKKMVSEYADDLFVTPNYLNLVTKRNTGFTASCHINQRIILEAKRLSIDSGTRLKEIAIKLGYDDFAHFSKFFKTNTGVNFTNFRKELYAVRNSEF